MAVITLDQEVPYAEFPNIQPICLAKGSAQFAKETAWVVGWGSLRDGEFNALPIYNLFYA